MLQCFLLIGCMLFSREQLIASGRLVEAPKRTVPQRESSFKNSETQMAIENAAKSQSPASFSTATKASIAEQAERSKLKDIQAAQSKRSGLSSSASTFNMFGKSMIDIVFGSSQESNRSVSTSKNGVASRPTSIDLRQTSAQESQVLDFNEIRSTDSVKNKSVTGQLLFSPHQKQQIFAQNNQALEYNESRIERIEKSIEAKYNRVAQVAPELLTIAKRLNLESSVKYESADWVKSSDVRYFLNFNKGMEFFNQIDVRQNYNRADQSGNLWMAADMNQYVATLKSQYMYVPDVVLETYVTAYLQDPVNQKYEKTLTSAYFLDDRTKPIGITPQALLEATKGEFRNKEYSGLEMPLKNGALDVQNLHDYQKLYLMMTSIEGISQAHPEYIADGLQMKDKQAFQNKKANALRSVGSYEKLMVNCGVSKENFSQLAADHIKNAASALEKSYPSLENVMNNYQDVVAFEQLQIDYITLNQDILAMKDHVADIANQSLKMNLEGLIEKAKNLSSSMNVVIVAKEVDNFMQDLLPVKTINSKGKRIDIPPSITIDTALDISKNLVPGKSSKKLSAIETILNEQKTLIGNDIKDMLQKIDASVKSMIVDVQDMKSILPVMEKAKNESRTAEESAKNRPDDLTAQTSFVIKQAVVGQLMIVEEKFQRRQELVDSIMADVLPFNASVETRDKAVVAALEKFNSEQNDRMVKNVIDRLITKYNESDFKEQNINDIIEKLDELIKENSSEQLKIYRQVFVDLHNQLEPAQLDIKKQAKRKTQIERYIKNLLLEKQNSISAAIKDVEEKIIKLDNQKNALDLSAEQESFNKRLQDENGKIVDSFDFEFRVDILSMYKEVLAELQVKQINDPSNKLRQNLYNIFIGHEVVPSAKNAVSSVPGAVVQVNDALTEYVYGIVKNLGLSAATLAAIAGVISAVSPLLVQINQSNASADDKHKMQQEALGAMMTDIGNLVVADKTGADVDIVAGRDAQAIATSGIFNKAINLLVPNDPTAGYSYNSAVTSPGYVSNVSKFQAQYNSILSNSYQPVQNNSFYTNPAQNSTAYSSYLPYYNY